MCFDPVTMAVVVGAVSALGSAVSQKMSMDTQNNAAAANYNQQVVYAQRVNQEAIQQQSETDSRNRIQTIRDAGTALTQAQQQVMANRVAMGTARASAGTSGMMGLPLNLIEQNYQSLIGGVGTNLQSTYKQMDENNFFNSMNTMLQAQSTTNSAIPNKPYLQSFGAANWAAAGLNGVTAGLGSYSTGQAINNGGTFNYTLPTTNPPAASIPRTNFGSSTLNF